MRNIILAVVAIAALTAAGIGGVFADFSDIEVSEDNYFKTGSLDLTVSNYLGQEYNGGIIPAFWQVKDAWPCCDKSIFFDLENWGQGFQKEPYAYMHMKNFECCWVYPKLLYKWIDEDGDDVAAPSPPVGYTEWVEGLQGTGFPKPVTEPEFVAECGGIAGEDVNGDPVEVPGVGVCYGENCTLPEHITVYMWVAGPWPHGAKPKTSDDVPSAAWTAVNLTAYDKNNDGVIKLNELECEEVLLGQIPNCNGIWVHAALHLQDIDEDDLGLHYFDETIPAEEKWDHWPTNAIQKDGVMFDIAFELLQNPVP